MRNLLWLSILGGLLTITLSAATIQYTVTPIGNPSQDEYQYTYYIGPSLTLSINQAIDIQFNITNYSNLTNAVADPTSDWTVMAFSPDPQIFLRGDYIALANVNNPSLSGPFTVDFTYVGTQQQPTPGSQPFEIDQYNSNGGFVGTLSTGTTSALVVDPPVPEPRGISVSVVGMLLVCIAVSARRRARRVTV